MKKIHLSLAALAAVGAVLTATACEELDAAGSAADPNLSVSAEPEKAGEAGAAAPEKEEPADDGLIDVVYKISGSANSGMLTYSTPSGQEQRTEKLPWKKSLKFNRDNFPFLSISAQNKGGGTITCTISVDGKVVKKATSEGQFTIASCDHTIGF